MSLTGIDASRHQGVIDWPAVAGAGHQFAFIKATDGISYRFIDWYHQNAPAVRASGMVLGAYHFLLDHHPGDAQARYYVDEVNRSGGFSGCVPIVDIEREADGTTPRIGHLRAFVSEFKRLVPGRAILIYTGRWYWVGVIGNPFGADLGPLWHSEYDGITPIEFDVANGPELDTYGGWNNCLVWQHTSAGIVPGVNGLCDRNLFYGDRNLLEALAGADAPPPPKSRAKDDDMLFLFHPEPAAGGGQSYVVDIGYEPISGDGFNRAAAGGCAVIAPNAADADAILRLAQRAADHLAALQTLVEYGNEQRQTIADVLTPPAVDPGA